MVANFLELNSKGLHQSSGKEKESCCLLFPSSTKCEIGQFHIAPGGILQEFLGGGVPLEPWNPQPIPELVQLNFATLYYSILPKSPLS